MEHCTRTFLQASVAWGKEFLLLIHQRWDMQEKILVWQLEQPQGNLSSLESWTKTLVCVDYIIFNSLRIQVQCKFLLRWIEYLSFCFSSVKNSSQTREKEDIMMLHVHILNRKNGACGDKFILTSSSSWRHQVNKPSPKRHRSLSDTWWKARAGCNFLWN